MHGIVSTLLALTLLVALVDEPAQCAQAQKQPAALGVLLVAQKANVGTDLAYSGAMIYDGDQLQTRDNGALLVRFRLGQITLDENSSVKIHTAEKGFSVELESGTAVVSCGEGQTFQLVADGATIRPLNAQPASAQITKLPSKELILTSTRGTLAASIGGEVKTVESGTSYRMEVEAGESEVGPQSSKTQGAGRSHFHEIATAAVSVAIILGIIRAIESGDRL